MRYSVVYLAYGRFYDILVWRVGVKTVCCVAGSHSPIFSSESLLRPSVILCRYVNSKQKLYAIDVVAEKIWGPIFSEGFHWLFTITSLMHKNITCPHFAFWRLLARIVLIMTIPPWTMHTTETSRMSVVTTRSLYTGCSTSRVCDLKSYK